MNRNINMRHNVYIQKQQYHIQNGTQKTHTNTFFSEKQNHCRNSTYNMIHPIQMHRHCDTDNTKRMYNGQYNKIILQSNIMVIRCVFRGFYRRGLNRRYVLCT